MDTNINFPNLHIFLEDVGKNIMIGDFAIAYYGIIIALGMVGGVLLATYIAKKSGQNPDDYYDIAIYGIIFALVGARLYYVAFRWEYYSQDLMRIFNIREGGLAIYGGVIAAVITVFVYTRIKKLNFGLVLDTAGPGLILGQCVGRWGNFFNREAFGGYSNNLFAMQLPVSAVRNSDITTELREHIVMVDGVSYIQVHPTFLYESMWNFCLLIILLVYWKHRKFNGEVFLLYLLGYGVGRFWIESLRTDQLLLPGIGYPVSMAVAACMVIGSLAWIIIKRMNMKKAEET
ncbi:MAG: prolipoprotein diacylglyceryl transferase [Agathobacter sp.]|nr:prolipoprotein diacylglyceryl transferase [Agathobacter sp.]